MIGRRLTQIKKDFICYEIKKRPGKMYEQNKKNN